MGSYRSWKTWKVMEFDNLHSRPGKSWNFGPGPGKSWNFMLANSYAAELPGLSDMYAGKTLNYGNTYRETVLSPLRFNINCTRQVGGSTFTTMRCVIIFHSLFSVNRTNR